MKPGEYETTGSSGYENPMEENITDIDFATRKTSSGDDETRAKLVLHQNQLVKIL